MIMTYINKPSAMINYNIRYNHKTIQNSMRNKQNTSGNINNNSHYYYVIPHKQNKTLIVDN